MAHTPGPWRSVQNPSWGQTINAEDGMIVAWSVPRKENAALVAAAPDLLEALKAADRLITMMAAELMRPNISDSIVTEVRDAGREWLRNNTAGAAIAKAEGRS